MTTYLSNTIRVQAFEMARSGEFIDCEAIEAALEKNGVDNARVALRDRVIRSRLDELCVQNLRRENVHLLRPANGRMVGRSG